MGPRGGKFVLTNPRENGGPIRYSLNEYSYTINPGESQTVEIDRNWVIRFENGLNRTVTYSLQEGTYDFTVSPQTGWDVARRVVNPPVAPGTIAGGAAPDFSTNAIPAVAPAPLP
jgi:hypothetical protein